MTERDGDGDTIGTGARWDWGTKGGPRLFYGKITEGERDRQTDGQSHIDMQTHSLKYKDKVSETESRRQTYKQRAEGDRLVL